ncbi:MAG TPA: DUF4440 domain-containing protein [Gemmatimonadaceae bacterium]|jgi:ketosteroid isomerase-like protein
MSWYRLLALAAVLPIACSSRRGADDVAAIRAARQAQNEAIARRDYTAIAQRWTEDITVRAGLGVALSGGQAYRDAFVADSEMTYTRTPDAITLSSRWPLAYERGHWIGRIRNAPNISLSGDYSAQWVKRGTEWLIRSELFVATECTGGACNWPASAP